MVLDNLVSMACAITLFFLSGWAPTAVQAQSVSPTHAVYNSTSDLCTSGGDVLELCLTLPPQSTTNMIDVFFLLDDSSSFLNEIEQVERLINPTVRRLERALPDVSWGFGVGRFEDFGGPSQRFSGRDGTRQSRPFILNQPILTVDGAGSRGRLINLLRRALNRTAPGGGGDAPEAAISEGLYQVAVGSGFDGNGDGSTNGNRGTQVAGRQNTQINPDTSGDVPAFATLHDRVVSSGGSVGGVGFREHALKLVILGTDICSVAAFAPPTLPTSIPTLYGPIDPLDFACSATLGQSRFGFVGNGRSPNTNTVENAVAPLGSHTVPETIAALNEAGIRVIGMGLRVDNAPESGPSRQEGTFLAALGRATGAINPENGRPYSISLDTSNDPTVIRNIVAAITGVAQIPANVALNGMCESHLFGSLALAVPYGFQAQARPGEQVCFNVVLNVTVPAVGACNATFQDALLNHVEYNSLPVNLDCRSNEPPQAVCKDVIIAQTPLDSNCQVMEVLASAVDGGSRDPDGDDAQLELSLSSTGPFGLGDSTVTLTVSDGIDTDSCDAVVTVLECGNQAPVAECQNDFTLRNVPDCEGYLSIGQLDGGSYDPDDDPLTFSVSPEGPYTSGETTVELTVSDGKLSDTCEVKVNVECVLPESSSPSGVPSPSPTDISLLGPSPTAHPSTTPTLSPSASPSNGPSSVPTVRPSLSPTSHPSTPPTFRPSLRSGSAPSNQPSSRPSGTPTSQPSQWPSRAPSFQPSTSPSILPTTTPSSRPSLRPSSHPTLPPNATPSSHPPSSSPSTGPSPSPSSGPSDAPCLCPAEDLSFVYNSAAASWDNHVRIAQVVGCTLASVTTVAEQRALNLVLGTAAASDPLKAQFAYIGGFRESRLAPQFSGTGRTAATGGWHWLDGSDFVDVGGQDEAQGGSFNTMEFSSSSSWNVNQPDFAGEQEFVMAVNRQAGMEGLWHDASTGTPDQEFGAVYKCCFTSVDDALSTRDFGNCRIE